MASEGPGGDACPGLRESPPTGDNAMNKIAVVTGASSGIGHAAALILAAQGVNCIVTYHRNGEGARELVRRIGDLGAEAVALPLDLGRSGAVAEFAEAVAAALQAEWRTDRFHYLVNSAGFGGMIPFGAVTEAEFDRFMTALLKGPFLLTQALEPRLADGGAIVNVTSNITGSGLDAGYTAYAAMKGGLSTLTRALAKELGPRRIRVNAVAPGPTRTRIGEGAFERHPELAAGFAAQTVLRRLGEPEDVGAVIAALLSDAFGWVTGQEIEVSGGYRL